MITIMVSLRFLSIVIIFAIVLGSDFRENVLRNLKNLCPKQYVPTIIDSDYNVSQAEPSCCLEYFNDSIEFRFHSIDTANNISGQQCLLPLIRRIEHPFQERKSYYMVTETPENGCVTINKSLHSEIDKMNNPTCNDSEIDNSLQRFLPVYSKASGFIYKNPHCALCHGITDMDYWQVLVHCKYLTEFSTDLRYCDFEFLFPRHEREISHLECLQDRYSSCPADLSSLRLPVNFDLSTVELRSACSIENLPKFSSNIYYAKNVFCFICLNNIRFEQLRDQVCSFETEFVSDEEKSLSMNSFTRLVDASALTWLGHEKPALKKTELICGIDLEEEVCYPVLCPLGQVMVGDGTNRACQMESTLWISPKFSLMLLFEFDKDISIHQNTIDTFTAKVFQETLTKSWIIVRMHIPFVRYTVSHHVKNFNYTFTNGTILNNVSKLFVDLTFKDSKAQPKEFMSKLREILFKEWYFEANRQKIKVRQELGRYSFQYIEASVPNLDLSMVLFVPSNLAIEYAKPSDRILYKPVTYVEKTASRLIITKLLICPQVEIPLEHFNVFIAFNNIVSIYHKHTGTIFFDREFGTVDAGASFRICVEDLLINVHSGNKILCPWFVWYYIFEFSSRMAYLLSD